jgi:WD40 repeat protein
MLLCENHTEAVLDVYYMPGVSDKFSTCSEDGTIRLWDANDYSVLARCSLIQAGIFPNVSIFTDEVIISGWSDGRIRSFKIEGSSPLWQIDNAHKNGVTAICLAYNQKFICSGGNDGECRVWEIRSRELVSHLKEHTSRVTKVQVFPDDIHMLTCARDRSILCWDLKNEKRVANQTQRMGGVNDFSIAPSDNNKFLSVGQERKITYWDLRKTQADAVLESSPYRGESDELLSICISHNNKYFVTGGQLGIVRIYDFSNGSFIAECKAHSSTITCVKFSPDDKQVVSTGRDGLVVVWNFFL